MLAAARTNSPAAQTRASCPFHLDPLPRGPEHRSTLSVSVPVSQHPEGSHDDLQVAPNRPARKILEVGMEAFPKVVALVGRAAIAADLGKPGNPGLDDVTMEIAGVDVPEE